MNKSDSQVINTTEKSDFSEKSEMSDKGKSKIKSSSKSHSKSKISQILKELSYPTDYLLNFNKEIIKSTLMSDDPTEQLMNILHEYNQGRRYKGKSSITKKSPFFGSRVEPNQFRLVALNNVPELVPPTEDLMRKRIFPFRPNCTTEELGRFNQNDLFIGAYGHFLVNVPIGKICKAWLKQKPILLGPGPHVIHDPNLREITREDLVDISQDYITHGTYHIIRVSPGNYAKIWIQNVPFFLPARKEPYVFNEAVFKYDRNDWNISYGYIKHGNFSIIQVPDGKVAKIWNGQTPIILESRKKPYIYKDANIRLEYKSKKGKKEEEELFESATEPVIIHGAKKRLMPQQRYAAVTYRSGTLVTYVPNDNKEPIYIDDPNHRFDQFFYIGTQTLDFPTKETKQRRAEDLKDNPNATADEVDYEVCSTSDGLIIGVCLTVVFCIEDPQLTLTQLNPQDVIGHIERVVVSDMQGVIKSCNSIDFLKTNQTMTESYKGKEDLISDVPYQPKFYEHLQDEVKNKLTDDFKCYGIKLVRLSIERSKICSEKIADEIAKYSLQSTQARATEENLHRNTKIAEEQAKQEAIKKRIAQEQENQNKVRQAEAELEAKKKLADAIVAEAEAHKKSEEMKLDVEKQRAQLYTDNPILFELYALEQRTKQLSTVNTMVVSPEVASAMYSGLTPMMKPIVASPFTTSGQVSFKNKEKMKEALMTNKGG